MIKEGVVITGYNITTFFSEIVHSKVFTVSLEIVSHAIMSSYLRQNSHDYLLHFTES